MTRRELAPEHAGSRSPSIRFEGTFDRDCSPSLLRCCNASQHTFGRSATISEIGEKLRVDLFWMREVHKTRVEHKQTPLPLQRHGIGMFTSSFVGSVAYQDKAAVLFSMTSDRNHERPMD